VHNIHAILYKKLGSIYFHAFGGAESHAGKFLILFILQIIARIMDVSVVVM
jgi:hypothetical protein